MRHLKSFASIAALLPLLGVAAGHAAPHGDAQACAALAGKNFGPGKIESARSPCDGSNVTGLTCGARFAFAASPR